MKMLLL